MKKLQITILLLEMIIIIFCGTKLTAAYSNEPTISYNGRIKKMTLLNIKDTDMFYNFKEMMPGDKKEQEIVFKLEQIKSNTKIFLETNEQELEPYIDMKMYINSTEIEKNKGTIYLGNFSKDSQVKLKVIIEIPKEVGNEIENLKKEIKWKILVQEDEDKLMEVPKTYDTNTMLYIIVMIISLMIMLYSLRKLLKDDNKNTAK